MSISFVHNSSHAHVPIGFNAHAHAFSDAHIYVDAAIETPAAWSSRGRHWRPYKMLWNIQLYLSECHF